MFYVPCSLGEIVDRVTILEIKIIKCTDSKEKKFLCTQKEEFTDIISQNAMAKKLFEGPITESLRNLNKKIWDSEVVARNRETKSHYQTVIDICYLNDKRTKLKNKINKLFYSETEDKKNYSHL